MSEQNITYLTDVSLLTCVVQSGLSEAPSRQHGMWAPRPAPSPSAPAVPGLRERLGHTGYCRGG